MEKMFLLRKHADEHKIINKLWKHLEGQWNKSLSTKIYELHKFVCAIPIIAIHIIFLSILDGGVYFIIPR